MLLSRLYYNSATWWCRDCHKIVDRIHDFLNLELKLAQAGGSPVFDLPHSVAPSYAGEVADSSPVTDDASSATSSDESFERVSTADLAEYDATATEAKPSVVNPLLDQADAESDTVDPADENLTSSSPADPLPHQADDECDTLDSATEEHIPSSSGDLSCE